MVVLANMHPYFDYEELIISLFDAPVEESARYIHQRFQQSTSTLDHLPFRHSTRPPNSELYDLEPREFDLSWAYLFRLDRQRAFLESRQLLFWEPDNRLGHTVMMSTEWGNQHSVFGGSKAVPWECIYVAMRDQRENRDPSYMFDYYRDYRQIHRSVGVGREEDGRWLFCEHGPVQPFESPENYRRRRILDRFNREVITEYLSRLGYDITDVGFWTSSQPAWILWHNCSGKKTAPTRHVYPPETPDEGPNAPDPLPVWR